MAPLGPAHPPEAPQASSAPRPPTRPPLYSVPVSVGSRPGRPRLTTQRPPSARWVLHAPPSSPRTVPQGPVAAHGPDGAPPTASWSTAPAVRHVGAPASAPCPSRPSLPCPAAQRENFSGVLGHSQARWVIQTTPAGCAGCAGWGRWVRASGGGVGCLLYTAEERWLGRLRRRDVAKGEGSSAGPIGEGQRPRRSK